MADIKRETLRADLRRRLRNRKSPSPQSAKPSSTSRRNILAATLPKNTAWSRRMRPVTPAMRYAAP